MKKLLFPFVLLLFAVAMQAQIQDPVNFSFCTNWAVFSK